MVLNRYNISNFLKGKISFITKEEKKNLKRLMSIPRIFSSRSATKRGTTSTSSAIPREGKEMGKIFQSGAL